MDAKTTIGRFVRRLREERGLTQEQAATRTGISYQFLSGLENGRENISLDTLESLAKALGCPFPQLVAGAYAPAATVPAPQVNPDFFRPQVPLPPGMSLDHLRAAMDATQTLVFRINANLLASGAKPLPQYIQGNNFSGLVSNVLCDALHEHSPYRHNSSQRYPDLISHAAKEHGKPVGLEVKSTVQIGKGGESHNGHSGWHLIACFEIEPAAGLVRFVHVMLAVLNGHHHPDPDWTYVGSKVNAATGSRRTETYNTTLAGTTKLRDGSVYLDTARIDFRRWRQARSGPAPKHSIFYGKDG
jgi:transcriptional regulator with XRE-family HTH domain